MFLNVATPQSNDFTLYIRGKKKGSSFGNIVKVCMTIRREIHASVITSSIAQKHFRKKKSVNEHNKPVPVSIPVTLIASYREGFIVDLL